MNDIIDILDYLQCSDFINYQLVLLALDKSMEDFGITELNETKNLPFSKFTKQGMENVYGCTVSQKLSGSVPRLDLLHTLQLWSEAWKYIFYFLPYLHTEMCCQYLG